LCEISEYIEKKKETISARFFRKLVGLYFKYAIAKKNEKEINHSKMQTQKSYKRNLTPNKKKMVFTHLK
jgi:zona occludens toxin (predicted ATPase)